ncbi:MAG: cytosine permease [Alteromonadaceae bacterium]|nr:cytosine permease [Alteromonadaceae bacterium]
MLKKIRQWWTLDAAEEAKTADNPLAPLTNNQRRNALPLLALAFGWGFLVTGLLTGGALGKGLSFMPDLLVASFLGNSMNFVIGALVGYIGYKTACNSGLLYRFTYGNVGAYIPVLFVALLTIGWQGITVGAFGYAWAQSFDSTTFYVVAIGAGILFTATTYMGVEALEKVSMPSVLMLVAVGLYATWLNIDMVGGWSAFFDLSAQQAATSPMSMREAINLVVGSWIVGSIVMADYTRFAKKAWVAIAIPFVVLIISQWFLQIIGSMGGIASGTYEFTTYMLEQGAVVGLLGVIAMSLALWTTGDTNLYLPAIQTASVFRKPKRVTTLICGVMGTVLGLGVYQYFLDWINLLAALVPPIIGPVIVDYYIVNRKRFNPQALTHLPDWNTLAIVAYVVGAGSAYAASAGIELPGAAALFPSLYGLVVSMVTYFILATIARVTLSGK